MADGVAITAGSGTTILTDDTGASGHAQVVKLAISTDGSATLIPAEATNGLDVDVTRVKPDGTNTMPSLDAAARRGYVQLTDGTNSIGASTAFGDGESNTQTVLLTEAYNSMFNGTTWDRVRGDTTSGLWVQVKAALPAGTNNIGDVDVLTVPTDPFGANADAASATGTISAKLRYLAATGIAGMTALPAGSALIGAVNPQGYFATCSTDITRPADTTAYAANDAMSDSTSAPTSGGFTFTSAARASGGSGIITDAIITTSADAATLLQGEIWIFNTSVTNVNDNAAFAVSDSEIKTCVGKIPFTLEDAGNNGFFHATNLNIGFTCSGSANLRFLVKVKNAYTPTSAEVLTFVIKCLQVT